MSFVGLATAIGGAAAGLGAGATASAIIGGVGAGALGGAGLGALSSAVTGGDIGKGAMFGALGGAVTGGLGSAFGGAGGSAAGAGTGSAASAGAPVAAAGTPAATTASAALPSTANSVQPLMGTMFGSPSMGAGVAPAATSAVTPAMSGSSALAGIPGVPAAYTPPTLPMSPVGAGATPMPPPTFTPQALPAGLENLGTLSQSDLARAAVQNSFFGQNPMMTIGAGSMLGSYMGTDSSPTQAGPPPGSGDNFLSYYKFNPRRYRPSQPFYIKPANYAAGGIASLNPNPDMMSSGPAQVDFMGADAYPTSQQKLNFYSTPSQMPTSAQQAVASYEPATNPLTGAPMANFARGGISDLGGYSDGGRMTEGPGDGMSDSIPASIAGKRPARLAQGEFVVPADVVSHLGNGSTDAGAKQLYSMMDRVRKARTGRKAQGKQIKAAKMMPA